MTTRDRRSKGLVRLLTTEGHLCALGSFSGEEDSWHY